MLLKILSSPGLCIITNKLHNDKCFCINMNCYRIRSIINAQRRHTNKNYFFKLYY